MNKNCQLFYKRLRILFPSIGFTEGKFLRDIKMQLRDFSIENPNATYEDVVGFFSNPEDVYMNYIHSQGIADVYHSLKTRQMIKYCINLLILFAIIIWITISLTWLKGYSDFNNAVPFVEELKINKGELYFNEN